MLRPPDIVQLLLVVLSWGLSFLAIKIGVIEVPPLFLTALRFAFAALPAVFFLKRPSVPIWHLAGYGLFLGVIQMGLLFWAIKLGLPSGLASLLLQLQAFFTIGLSVLFFKDHVRKIQILAIAVAFGGCAIIATERLIGASLIPLLMIVLAAAAWGAANVITKHSGHVVKSIDMLAYVAWSSLFAPLPLFLASYLIDGHTAFMAATHHLSPTVLGVSAYMGWIATIGGFGLWAGLLSRYPTGLIAPFTLLVPVVGFVGGAIAFRERITTLETIGAVIIFAGLMINMFAMNRSPIPALKKDMI